MCQVVRRTIQLLSCCALSFFCGCRAAKSVSSPQGVGNRAYGHAGTSGGRKACFDDAEQAYSLGAAISVKGTTLYCTETGWKR
jgi:hypothetical protein